MSARHHLDRAQRHAADAHHHVVLAQDAYEVGGRFANFHASMAAAHGALAQLELLAGRQELEGVPREARIDRYHPNSLVMQEARRA